MIKNIIVSALVALVVGSFAGGIVAMQIQPAPVSESLGAAGTGDTTTNYQNFANDVRISGNAALGTTTLRLLSRKLTQGACIETNATSSGQLINLRYIATSTLVSAGITGGVVGWNYGACK